MIEAIAIDDEPLALRVLEEHCAKINFLQLQQTFTDPVKGIAYIGKNKLQAVFLDIKMHDLSGIELAELLPPHICLIFITAYPDFAVKGFELNAVDYLLKPITFSRFLKTCHRLKNHLQPTFQEQIIHVKDGTEISRIKASEIYYVEAMGNYLKLFTTKGLLLHRQTMKEIEAVLPETDFIRTHKSYMVNINHISRIETYQLTIDHQKIPLGLNFKQNVWKKLGIR